MMEEPPGTKSAPSSQDLAAGRGYWHAWGAFGGFRLQPRLSGEEEAASPGCEGGPVGQQ